MKIKTITCHDVYNYGASLQEYALITHLKQSGFEDVETINYKPWYLSHHFNIWLVNHYFFSRNYFTRFLYILLKLPKRLYKRKRKKRFDLFTKQFIPTTEFKYKSNQDLIDSFPEADVFICGSDQIWNSYFENGKDPAFYLDFVPENKLKISYAASFAIDKLDEKIAPFVKKMVSKIDHVSVRESSGVKILDSLGIYNAKQVLDPVFLIDRQHWDTVSTKKKENDKFILVYDFDSNPAIRKLAETLKSQHHWKIYAVNEQIAYADSNYFLQGPQFFLDLVKNAQFVISNSFHAVAFSIIYKKNFVVFNRKEEINTRMRDLLTMLGLEKRLFAKNDIVVPNELDDIDYTIVEKKLDPIIYESKSFLQNSLKLEKRESSMGLDIKIE